MNFNARKIVLVALFACVAMGLYALESCIPPLIPVPGVKLGIANTITLIVFYSMGKKAAFAQLVLRIMLTALLFGHFMTLSFSITGGVFSFVAVCVCARFVDETQLWATGVFAAMAHNLGQILIAILITGQPAVSYYFLVLIISAIVTGLFTGVCAAKSIKLIKNLRLL